MFWSDSFVVTISGVLLLRRGAKRAPTPPGDEDVKHPHRKWSPPVRRKCSTWCAAVAAILPTARATERCSARGSCLKNFGCRGTLPARPDYYRTALASES
ncbi:hypothetical protein ACFPRL_06865 [Pseudoclavibacter helvolus]